jgi:hypothetical protein
MAMHPSSNEQVFEATVRELLGVGGVSVVEQEPASLLEAVLHGEGSQESALNLIVHAHVAHLILRVFTPFQKDPWTEQLESMTPHFIQALESCHKLLRQLPPPKNPRAAQTTGGWQSVIPVEYQLGDWDDLTGDFFYNGDFSIYILGDLLVELYPQGPEGRLGRLVKSTGEIKEETPTTWRRLFVADVIQRVVVAKNELPLDQWSLLVDLCANFMSASVYHGSGISLAGEWEENGTPVDTTDIEFIKAPVATKEFWAWQFGRVAALAHADDYPLQQIDNYGEWGNGVIAFSLLLGSGNPQDWNRRIVSAIVTSDNQRIKDVNDLRITSHLYWLMHIGVSNVIRQSEKPSPRLERELPAGPSESNALLLGSNTAIAEKIWELMELAERQKQGKVTNSLKQHVPQIWDMLPPDAQAHLVEAELNLGKRKLPDASLDYANSVEAAMSEWLPNQKGVSWWPQTLGDLSGLAKRMTAPNPQVDRGLQEIKRRFDVKYAAELRNALEVIQTARLSRAHGHQGSPRAHTARDVALGIDRTSVFELMLRFTKRWRG